MAIEVFARKEMKYIMDAERYKHITEFMLNYMNYDEHNHGGQHYTIANIYYDTYDHNIIRQSVAKPKYKEKLRLRAYGVPEMDSKVYLEIKKKYLGVVYKRRVTLKLDQAYEFVETREILPETSKRPQYVKTQVMKELQQSLLFYKPVPMIYLAYDRIAFFGKDPSEGGPGRDLRISFDFNTRTRREDVRLEMGDHGEPLLKEGWYVMEVKAGSTLPRWLLDYFAEHGMRRGSVSKYGTEYKRFLRRQIIAESAETGITPNLPPVVGEYLTV
ncbi:MAG: polyphosphate polymerase domain-containing protein [Oscillospiraceae bacterium]|nr:polyphosphate polymerase domain-containing protein [Oscillospiraceae bacterium]